MKMKIVCYKISKVKKVNNNIFDGKKSYKTKKNQIRWHKKPLWSISDEINFIYQF